MNLPAMSSEASVRGAGLGLRTPFIEEFADATPRGVDFVEITAEHYLRQGGRQARLLKAILEQVPAVCHALNSNLGGSAPLSERYLLDIKRFLDLHRIDTFSDHLCHSGDQDWMHNLMPIPFTDEAVRHTARRIRRAQEVLERTIVIENISYMAAPGRQMPEQEFVAAVLEEADCMLLLDINNLYVNSINMDYSAEEFLDAIPGERIVYAHVAGHLKVIDWEEGEDEEERIMYLDSHAHPVSDPVLRLLESAYRRFGIFPTVVERDLNIPPVTELLAELAAVRELQHRQEHSPAVLARSLALGELR